MSNKKNGKIISITSVKGGVGKTTMTINLAGIYSQNYKTLIIDADFTSGGISTWLDIRYKKDIYTLIDNIENNRYTTIKDYTTSYNKNLDILPSPKDPRSAIKINAKYLPIVFELAKREYDIILVDTNHIMDEKNLCIIDNSYMTLFMITNDLIDIKNMKNMISIISKTEKKNYLICLNNSRDTGRDYLSLFDIRNILRCNIDYTIPANFYIKNIDKYVMHGEILTLSKNIRRFHPIEIKRLESIAKELINDKYKESDKND